MSALGADVRASVVVVTYNHADVVGDCLRALGGTLGPADEVVVVDNASADGTPAAVLEALPAARLIRLERNLGFGAACNRGASAAAGRYLVFLNPDTEPAPGWIDALLAPLEADPALGLTTARLLLQSLPHLVDTFGNEVHVSGITTSRGWGEPADWHARDEEVSAVSGACFGISRDVFHRLGGFDERLFLYFEDTDLSLRARLAGYHCLAVTGARVLHAHAPGFSPAKLRYLERNRYWSLLKLYRGRTLASLTPALLLAEAVAWGMALSSGPGHVAAKALAGLDVLRWLPALPAARASVQATRRVSDRDLLTGHATRLRFRQVRTGLPARLGETLVARLFALARRLALVAA